MGSEQVQHPLWLSGNINQKKRIIITDLHSPTKKWSLDYFISLIQVPEYCKTASSLSWISVNRQVSWMNWGHVSKRPRGAVWNLSVCILWQWGVQRIPPLPWAGIWTTCSRRRWKIHLLLFPVFRAELEVPAKRGALSAGRWPAVLTQWILALERNSALHWNLTEFPACLCSLFFDQPPPPHTHTHCTGTLKPSSWNEFEFKAVSGIWEGCQEKLSIIRWSGCYMRPEAWYFPSCWYSPGLVQVKGHQNKEGAIWCCLKHGLVTITPLVYTTHVNFQCTLSLSHYIYDTYTYLKGSLLPIFLYGEDIMQLSNSYLKIINN